MKRRRVRLRGSGSAGAASSAGGVEVPPTGEGGLPPVEEGADEATRGRPGRRSVSERQEAVLALFAGKATVDQLATRFGVLPSTIEQWRADALEGIDAAFRQGAKTPRERELERENKELRAAVTDLSIRNALIDQALKMRRPSPPGRSR